MYDNICIKMNNYYFQGPCNVSNVLTQFQGVSVNSVELQKYVIEKKNRCIHNLRE